MDLALEGWQVKEMTLCMLDPSYFLETFGWLEQKASAGVSETSGLIPFEMGEKPGDDFYFQREILGWLHDRENVTTLKSRRVGCSWVAAGYIAWLVNFFEGVHVVLISRNGTEAKKILAKVRFILKNLKFHDHDNMRLATDAGWLRGDIAVDNQQELAIGWRDDSGEITSFSTVESITTTDDAARGGDATFMVFDELAFYEHPDETWSSAMKALARGGHWLAISTPNSIGDVFHRLCSRGELEEKGKLTEELGYKYIRIHWSEAGITPDQVRSASVGETQELSDREWELQFISPGTTVFNPIHLAACYKPLDEYPEVARELESYRIQHVNGRNKYYSGVDTIHGRVKRKSTEKDYNAWVSLTRSNIQAFSYYDQKNITTWAGKNQDNAQGGRVEVEGKTTKLHRDWPGVAGIEWNGPGLTTWTNHRLPDDTFSDMVPVDMNAKMKRGIIERLVLKVESQGIVITCPFTYQCMMVFQKGGSVGQYAAPNGYYDDLVIAMAIASDEVDKAGALEFSFGDQASDAKRVTPLAQGSALPGSQILGQGPGSIVEGRVIQSWANPDLNLGFIDQELSAHTQMVEELVEGEF